MPRQIAWHCVHAAILNSPASLHSQVIIGGTKLDYVKPAQLNDGPCWWDAPAASCSGSGVNPPPYQPAALRCGACAPAMYVSRLLP